MAIATTIVKHLADNGIAYDILPHRPTYSSMTTAHAAQIPGAQLAKCVILEDDNGYLMAVLPATRHVKIGEINKLTKRNMGLATEVELSRLFSDCELGAIPPLGEAYGIDTVVDSTLDECGDVYFEAGDHEELIHVKGSAFQKLMKNSQHGNICAH